MNVEIGAEAAQLPEKEYINGIAVAVQDDQHRMHLAQIDERKCTLNVYCTVL
jgi:hypothetical protein